MGDSLAMLRNRIRNTEDLRGVVKTMKAMSAASIHQFEQAVESLEDYCRVVEMALSVCLRSTAVAASELPVEQSRDRRAGIVALGSDQGMVGQFNEHIVEAVSERFPRNADPPSLWVVGERAEARFQDAGHRIDRLFATPQSIEAIAPLVSELLFEIESDYVEAAVGEVTIIYNSPLMRSNYETSSARLLPLDKKWRSDFIEIPWPTANLPEMIDCGEASQSSLISEYLFVSLYHACAASCAAENAARLAAMQRAEKSIDERRRTLDLEYNHQRQSVIDEELFDLISGFEALSNRD